MVASIRRRADSHRWAWLVGIALGLFIGELTMATGWLGIAFGVAGAVMVVLKGPRRAALGGYLLGAGGAIALVQARRFGLCPYLETGPDPSCETAPSLGFVEAAAALVVLGFASTLIAIRRSGGDGGPKPGRREGALVALGITIVAAAIEVAVRGPQYGRFDPLATALLPGWGAPTVAAGLLAGWTLGPLARKAKSLLDWVGLTFGVACAAVLFGAVAVGALTGIINAASVGFEGAPAIVAWVPYGLAVAVFGLILAGPFVLGPALIGALIWSFVMARRLRSGRQS